MLEADTKRALELESVLTSKITSLVKEYSMNRSKALQDSAQSLQDALNLGLKENESFSKLHPRTFDGLRAHGTRMTQTVTEQASKRHTAEQQMSNAVWAIDENVKAVMSAMSHEFGQVIDGQGREIKNLIESSSKDVSAGMSNRDINLFYTDCFLLGFAEVRRTKRARTELENKLCPEIMESYQALGSANTALSRTTSHAIGKRLEEETARRQATQDIQSQIQGRLSALRQANRTLMTDGTRPDVPTGSTPKKRTWEDDDAWEHSSSRGSDWAIRQMLQEQQKRDSLQRQLLAQSVASSKDEPVTVAVATVSTDVRDTADDVDGGEEEENAVDEGPSGEHTGPLVLESAPGAPPPYTREEISPIEVVSKVAIPAVRSVRQRDAAPSAPAPTRPPSKIGGGIARKVSGKAAAPLIEKNAGARSKRVR